MLSKALTSHDFQFWPQLAAVHGQVALGVLSFVLLSAMMASVS
jgi:hypothetical protein